MSDDASYDDPHDGGVPAWHPDALLSPGPSAVVAFTLAVLVLTGNNLLVFGTQAFFGQLYTSSETTSLVVYTVGSLVPAAASLYLAGRALVAGATSGWETVLARAAVVLAVVGVFYSLLTLIGALIHRT
jgi:hypothetical protein